MAKFKRQKFRLCASTSIPRLQCSLCNKDSHNNETTAQRAAMDMSVESHLNLNIYRCPHGNGWHLTKNQ